MKIMDGFQKFIPAVSIYVILYFKINITSKEVHPMLIFLTGFLFSGLAAFAASRLAEPKQNLLLNILAVLLPLSEIWKQLLLTAGNGGSYLWWYFPFQLCSMPLYLLPLRQLLLAGQSRCRTSQKTKAPKGICSAVPDSGSRKPQVCVFMIRTLTDFLADFGLLAGIFAFADQTGMHYSLSVLTLHSYLWHFIMIFLGLFLILSERRGRYSRLCGTEKKLPCLRSFLPAAALFLLLAAIAELLNFLLHTKGRIDMFYISPWEPASQVILRDVAAQIGREAEIVLYLCLILLGGFLIHTAACRFRHILPPYPDWKQDPLKNAKS